MESVAFPSISTGVYGYPTEKAATEALQTIRELAESGVTVPISIQFVLFDDVTYSCYADALSDL